MRRIVIPTRWLVWGGVIAAIIALTLMVLALRGVAAERDARIEAVAASQLVACERQNELRRALALILVESREMRRAEGRANPEIERLYDRYIARVGPVDCTSVIQRGSP